MARNLPDPSALRQIRQLAAVVPHSMWPRPQPLGMRVIDYLNMVDDLLEARYGITSGDVGMGAIASCQDDGWTPEKCVEWLAGKWELVWVSLAGELDSV